MEHESHERCVVVKTRAGDETHVADTSSRKGETTHSDSFEDPCTPSLTHTLSRSLIHSEALTHSLIHSITHSLARLFTDALTHSLT